MSEAIFQKIARIREILKTIDQIKGNCADKFNSDVIFRGALLHYLYLMADSCISLGELVIKLKGLRSPQSYHETIDILGEARILDEEFAYDFAKIAGFRNFLAHDYQKINKAMICDSLDKKINDVNSFIAQIETVL